MSTAKSTTVEAATAVEDKIIDVLAKGKVDGLKADQVEANKIKKSKVVALVKERVCGKSRGGNGGGLYRHYALCNVAVCPL